MNITIAKLGNEQCEMCELYENHKKQYQCELVCDIREYLQHKKKYRAARNEYPKDRGDKNADHVGTFARDHLRVSADLQKVILLPRMGEFKEGIFTPRLVVFNETIATLSKGGTELMLQLSDMKPYKRASRRRHNLSILQVAA